MNIRTMFLAGAISVALLVATAGGPINSVDAQQSFAPGVLSVSPTTLELGQSFSLSADACPGENPVGADYRVEFQIDFLPPPQLPGDPDPGSYSVTLMSTPIEPETFVASWSIPGDAPTLGNAYRVTATCIGNELGGDFDWFVYPPVDLTVLAPSPPALTASSTTVALGDPFTVTATQCPGPRPVGADYRVEYTVAFLPPPQLPGDPDPGAFQQVYIVPGAGGTHELEITLPLDAPTLGGAYRLSAECWGNELGSDFLWHDDYAPVNLTVIDAGPRQCNGLDATVRLALGETPTTGDDVIIGTRGPDRIDGRGGNDVICALGGDDVVRGGDGADVIFAGSGNDTVHAMAGDDVVWGQLGRDRLYGYDGDDRLFGGYGRDRLRGHAGDDVLIGNQGADNLFGYSGDDILRGNQGADLLMGNGGNDTLLGYAGNDRLIGGEGNDVLHGNLGDDVLAGSDGRDRLFGYDGDDQLDGGAAVDICRGNAGNDTAMNCEVAS